MVIGRRNNVTSFAEDQLPLTNNNDENGVDESSSPFKRNKHGGALNNLRRNKRPFGCCSYRGAVVTITAGMFYLFTMSTRIFYLYQPAAAAADPCQVAQETAAKLKRLRLEGLPNNNNNTTTTLPNIIHHQWKDESIPAKYQEWHDAWYTLYPSPEYTHMLWTDASARQLVKEHYAWFLPTYDKYEYPIQRADAVRYFYLHHYGGLHTDLDYEPLSGEIFHHLPQDRVALVESPYKFSEETQNSFMSSPKGHVFWLHVFRLLVQHQDKRVLSSTGPQLLDVAMKSCNSTLQNIHVLPCENFHRIPMGDGKSSPFITKLVRGVLARTYPMKQCGSFQEKDKCHFARHHNTAVYVAESTWWDLIWNM